MKITRGQLRQLIKEIEYDPADPHAGQEWEREKRSLQVMSDAETKKKFLEKVNWSAWFDHFVVTPKDKPVVIQAVTDFYDRLDDEMAEMDL
jgi:hypothetical protein